MMDGRFFNGLDGVMRMWTNSYSLEQLGSFLADVRKEKGYTQAEFARVLGVSHATLSNLEQGKNTSTDTLQRALQLLGLRIVVVPKIASVDVDEEGSTLW